MKYIAGNDIHPKHRKDLKWLFMFMSALVGFFFFMLWLIVKVIEWEGV